MHLLWHLLFGIDPAAWTGGGSLHVEFLALPAGDWALIVLIAIFGAAWGTLWLYRREGRGLSRRMQFLLTALRLAAVLGVILMLLEPELVFSKREYSPSNLVVLLDVSQSMDLADTYTDAEKAKRLAQVLELPGGPHDLGTLSRLAMAQRLLEGKMGAALKAKGDRIVRVVPFAGTVVPQAATQPSGSATASDPRESAVSSPAHAAREAQNTPDSLGSLAVPLNNPTSVPGVPVRVALDQIDRSATGIGTAIRESLAACRGQPVAGILLITDGQSNTGEAPAKAAEGAAEGVPIVSLAAGTPQGPRNATLNKIDVNPVVLVGDPNQLHVLIESRGMEGQTASVILERRVENGPWEEAGRQSITLGESGQLQSVPFEFTQAQPARLTFRATIADAGPELTLDDNTAIAQVRAIRARIRVLFVAGTPFPEVQFIRNALMRDKGVDLSSWLQTADPGYEQPGTTPIQRLPNTQEELDGYDCVILYDPDPALWPPEFPQLLTDFVAQAGGGLVYIAGERTTKQLFEGMNDPSAAWLNLLPVVYEPALYQTDVSMRLSAREAWKMEITPEGQEDEIFRFGKTPEENQRILASLPGMFWHFPVTRAKAGATVLARVADPRMRNQYGQEVLLTTQLVGPGRTFFLGFDSTYRWRYLDEQYFDGFWARVVDRAGRSKQLGGRYPFVLATDRQSYRPGSQVQLTATFQNPQEMPGGLNSLQGEIDAGDGAPTPVVLAARAGQLGTFDATFAAGRSGPRLVRVWAGAGGGGADSATPDKPPRAATLQFQVELPNLEYQRPGVDRATLETLARTTGGAVFDLDQADQVPAAFKVTRVAHVLEDHQEVWHAPILWCAILGLVFAEWILRKRSRLV